MGNWFLVACLGTAGAGVLAFLRLVSNEIDVVEREAAWLRKAELSKRRRAQEDAIVLESAA